MNTELCEKAGVDYTAIASWDDLLAAAEKISALGSDIYGLAIPDSNGVEAGEGYNTFPLCGLAAANSRRTAPSC